MFQWGVRTTHEPPVFVWPIMERQSKFTGSSNCLFLVLVLVLVLCSLFLFLFLFLLLLLLLFLLFLLFLFLWTSQGVRSKGRRGADRKTLYHANRKRSGTNLQTRSKNKLKHNTNTEAEHNRCKTVEKIENNSTGKVKFQAFDTNIQHLTRPTIQADQN